jgi:hypothetical protein
MDRMGDEKDMFEGLGCHEEIENLGEPIFHSIHHPSVREMREVLEIDFVTTMSWSPSHNLQSMEVEGRHLYVSGERKTENVEEIKIEKNILGII